MNVEKWMTWYLKKIEENEIKYMTPWNSTKEQQQNVLAKSMNDLSHKISKYFYE